MTMETLSAVKSSINFFVAPQTPGEHAYIHINANSQTGKRKKNFNYESKEVVIENVRGEEGDITLDTAGFQLVRQPVKHKTFLDDAEIQREYYPESIKLLESATGASRVVIFDHTVRRRRPGVIDDSPTKRQPVSHAHVDQTTNASIARVYRHLPADEASELLKHRFQIINLWRPISHSALDWPLALCDHRSIDAEKDVIPITLIYPDHEGETFGVKYNLGQKWKYFHNVMPDEAILFKCFDSMQDGSVAVFTPHAAFHDPTTPAGVPLRESIELRALVFYD